MGLLGYGDCVFEAVSTCMYVYIYPWDIHLSFCNFCYGENSLVCGCAFYVVIKQSFSNVASKHVTK